MSESDHELLTVDDLAAQLKVSRKTILNWRSRRVGPPAVKVVGALRYRRNDVDRWLRQGSNHPGGPAA